MQFLYLLVAAVALYALSDWLLGRIEVAMGRRLEQRSVIFFGILLTSALASFTLVRFLFGT